MSRRRASWFLSGRPHALPIDRPLPASLEPPPLLGRLIRHRRGRAPLLSSSPPRHCAILSQPTPRTRIAAVRATTTTSPSVIALPCPPSLGAAAPRSRVARVFARRAASSHPLAAIRGWSSALYVRAGRPRLCCTPIFSPHRLLSL
ncbi:hypothetical protein Scep_016392 [Stephania cephalantha]|uniref:Uncharacterized protein n=1 Tax=Stephania cephalantha TaxID=152367 RepID=A0AAP0NU50_9MAGN